MAYNSQASFNVSNNSFNTTTNSSSLLDQSYSTNSNGYGHPSSAMTAAYIPNQGYVSPTTASYKQNTVNLPAINLSGGVDSNGSVGSDNGNYSPNFNYNNNYNPTSYAQNTSSFDTSYDNLARKSIEDHMKKQIDEQLLSKVSQLSLEHVTRLLEQKQREYKSTSNIILNQIQTSKEIASSCRDISTDKEEFY